MSLFVAESFSDYGTSAALLHNKNGGIGWSAAWVTNPTTGTPPNSGIMATIAGYGQTYSGLTSYGTLSAQLWIAGSGGVAASATRTCTTIPYVAGQKIWIALLTANGYGKDVATLKIPGITTDSAGATNASMCVYTGNNTPVVVNPTFNSTKLYNGDSAETFATHLLVYNFTMGATSTTSFTCNCWADPNLAKDFSLWGTATANATLYCPTGITGFSWTNSSASSTTNTLAYARLDEFRIASTLGECIGNSDGKFFNFFW